MFDMLKNDKAFRSPIEKFLDDVESRWPECHDFSTCVVGQYVNEAQGCVACKVRFSQRAKAALAPSTNGMFEEMLTRLNSITADCREDMHEPDEQDIFADVVGTHLDNAMGDVAPPHNCGEFLVKITKKTDSTKTTKSDIFNLASLIALARKARL